MTASYAQRASKILRDAGLAPKKSWGQNFLKDDTVLQTIVQAADVPQGGTVLELGAGLGALTLALLEGGVHVVAVERDRELVPLLRNLAAHVQHPLAQLTVCETDAARLNYGDMAQTYGAPLHVLGNLPYQLSGRILVSMAEAADFIGDGVVLVQKEVGERLAAGPGSKAYGLLSVLVQRRFAVRLVREVPPGAFLPPPKVHSMVVRLKREDAPAWQSVAPDIAPAVLESAMVRVARAAFGTRRKTLRNALANGLREPKEVIEQALAVAGVDPSARAETLHLVDFAKLGAAFAACTPRE
jgi:16S rRNA (adenine1518-N6/adenine1519-N6)-dimethyltransferase